MTSNGASPILRDARKSALLRMTVPSNPSSLPLGAGDAFQDQLVRILGATPSQYLHPFPGFEVLVVLEEVLDLLQRDVGQIAVGPHLVVALGQLRRGYCDDFLV